MRWRPTGAPDRRDYARNLNLWMVTTTLSYIAHAILVNSRRRKTTGAAGTLDEGRPASAEGVRQQFFHVAQTTEIFTGVER